ncbi:MAG: type I restriction enzyme HsdR N-terminal domain-containing protein [Thermoplasmatales archaeon]
MIIEKEEKLFIKCKIKDKCKPAKPEEIVRQLFIHRLISEYNYPKERINVEKGIKFGSRDSGLADVDPFSINNLKVQESVKGG